jgi:hypothetical protein
MFEGRNQNMGITMEKRIYLAKRVRSITIPFFLTIIPNNTTSNKHYI